MMRVLCLSLILASFVGCHNSKRTVFLPGDSRAPEERATALAEEKAVDLDALEAKYGDAPGVLLEYLAAYEHIVSGFMDQVKWSSYEVSRQRMVVLDPKDKNMIEFSRSYSGSKTAQALRLFVTHPNQERQDFSKKLLVSKNEDGDYVAKFRIPDLERGSVIEFQLELSSQRPTLMEEFPLQFSIPAEKIDIKYTYPRDWKAYIKEIRPGVKPNIERSYDKDERKNVISAKANDVPALTDEPFEPYFKESADYLLVNVYKVKSGPLFYEADKDWDTFAKGYRKRLKKLKGFFGGGMGSKLREITDRDMSKREKAEAIVNFVQENIDLENPDEDADFDDVWSKKSGNPWINTMLARELMIRADVRPDLILIHTADEGYFDKKLIHGSQVPIPALRAAIDGETYVYFPFIRGLPANFIPPTLQNQEALLIPESGASSFVKVPPGKQTGNLRRHDYQMTLQDNGIVTINETISLEGSPAYRLRGALQYMDEDEREEILEEFLSFEDGDVDLKTKSFENQDDASQPLIIKLTYEINNILTVMEDEVLFNTAGLFSPISELKTKVESDKRVQDVVIYYDSTTQRNINIQYPASWELLEKPKDFEKSNDFGSAKMIYQSQLGKMIINQEVDLKRNHKPKEAFSELLELIGDSVTREVPTLIFEINS